MQKTSTPQPTVEQWVEHGARHYSPALDDADYFRTKFRALRECLAHAFPDRPLGGVTFGAEDTPVGRFLDEYAEHLLRACGNSAYWDNGEMSDLLFHWHETFPLVRDYLARRGLAKGILDELARIETDQQAKDFRQLIRKALDADKRKDKQGVILVEHPCGFTDKDRETLEQCAVNAKAANNEITQTQKELLDKLDGSGYTDKDRERDERAAKDAHMAAASKLKELEGKSKGGKKGAGIRKDATGKDPIRKKLERWVRDRKREWDREHPERKKPGYKKHYSDNQIYRDAEKLEINNGDNDKPIYSADKIKEWFKPSKVKRRGGRVK